MATGESPQVLIVGAGPTGLVLALWLARAGVRVRIIDKAAEPGTSSRALAVQPRTLEFYRQMGLADAVLAAARKMVAVNLWVAGRRAARMVFGDMGRGISAYSYMLIYPQDEHERLLIERLSAAGVRVERPIALSNVESIPAGVRATLTGEDGATETCEVDYVAGCDGAHSVVRETLRLGFKGGTYEHLFYVADTDAAGPAADGELHVALDASEFLALFPLKAAGRVRLIGTMRQTGSDSLSWNDVSRRVIEWMRIDVKNVNWFSTYRVHHRVAERFRSGRVFLLGDAAHIHSPVGGQGMNTGIGDAVNLAWKLAAVLRGDAGAALLDSYEPERIAFADRLVATTDRAFVAVTSSGRMARWIRLRVVPVVMPMLFTIPAFRRMMFRTVSQTAVHYRHSGISEGKAGSVRGGDRLPWLSADVLGSSSDNFDSLNACAWQVHVYGTSPAELRAACAERHLRLFTFPWRASMLNSGLQRNAVYLIRPDGYVAFATRGYQASRELVGFLEKHRLRSA